VTFEIFKAFPPDRESAVAELYDRHDGVADVPAQVTRENGELTISIFGREGGVAWTYPLDDWVGAIQRAVEVLGDG
jgi:hypothetical protein